MKKINKKKTVAFSIDVDVVKDLYNFTYAEYEAKLTMSKVVEDAIVCYLNLDEKNAQCLTEQKGEGKS